MKLITSLFMLLMIMVMVLFSGCMTQQGDGDTQFKGWNLTLSCDGKESHLSLADLKKMPVYTGNGYLVSTTGIKYGPFVGTGVPLSNIVQTMGKSNENSRVYLYGSDEYLWVLESGQVSGDGYITFDENLSEIHNQKITPVLMYEQDGKSLSQDDGGPVRFALLTDHAGVITEGSGWVKWVSRVELHQ
ncbi:molybdopterin-dependent oxidoreductase [Methanospirillum lacunae]|nr:molybdopterin-dependent oxidoreductase [Methanospirillum lacunae]